jgi:hypothetical protein
MNPPTSYLVNVEPIIGPTARKHGLRDEDILHAFRNPVDVFETANGMTMFVGADRVGVNLLEVGFFGAEEDEAVVIVHAMVARPKFLR